MRKAFLWLLTVFVLSACVSTRYVPIESVKTEYKTNYVHDTTCMEIVKHDSMAIIMAGDTVHIHHWHTQFQDRWRNVVVVDSFIRTDSIPAPFPVEKELTTVEQFCIDWFGWYVAASIIIFVLLYKRRNR